MIDQNSVPHLPGVPVRDHDVDVDIVRSEERLRVSTVSVPKERVRFEKVIVSEERTVTITVRREELRVVREPLFEAELSTVAAGSTSAAEKDFVLHEERVIVSTEIVPVERVRVSVARIIEDLPVTALLRKERVEIATIAP